MPLFESRQKRNERLLQSAAEEACGTAYDSFSEDTVEMARYSGWFAGAVLSAHLILNESSELKKHWRKGDEHKAERVLEVFTLAMISRYYRFLETRVIKPWEQPDEERQQVRETTATNVLKIFNRYSPQALEDFVKMDVQYIFDKDKTESDEDGTSYVELDLICWRAAIACGAQLGIDLSKVTFPLTSDVDTVAADIPQWHPSDREAVSAAMATGFTEMIDRAGERFVWQ